MIPPRRQRALLRVASARASALSPLLPSPLVVRLEKGKQPRSARSQDPSGPRKSCTPGRGPDGTPGKRGAPGAEDSGRA
ncbi:hypothetical protein NDU88_000751 [Pleurodeles waltl]|uniref:Uncharacterized protein n=1 Tax=Pleurodeles waltl TaxID=8319 RepID=A0AAV7KYQ1_PLEWA|nr:hypothetical protein NDU88_000751 [Pleurodeles waltl]